MMEWQWNSEIASHVATIGKCRYGVFVGDRFMPFIQSTNCTGYLLPNLSISSLVGEEYRAIKCSMLEEAKARCERHYKLAILRE